MSRKQGTDRFKNRLVSCLRRQEFKCSGENGSQVSDRVHTRVRSEGSGGIFHWRVLTDTKKGSCTVSLVNSGTFSVELCFGSGFLDV